jgi:fermentation-respiration switch protein FrsA (DUF1100 family)
MAVLVKAALAASSLYALVIGGGYLIQRRLMYFPDIEHTLPSAMGLVGVDERILKTPDGAQVIAWYTKAPPGQPTILYFHGNAGSLKVRAERVRKFQAAGRGILMMTYRGYGGSTGSPSERFNVADAGLAYSLLIREGVRPRDIILFGESLGSGVAVQIAAANEVGGLIMDSPYTSMVEVAQVHYPWLPVRQLLVDRYDTMTYIGRVQAPLLVLHGERDQVVPVAMGRAVFAAAGEPKQIATFKEAGHIEHYLYGSFDVVQAWIDRVHARTLRSGG